MEETLVALLLNDAAVALIAGQRVNWSERGQGAALPAVVLHRISGVRDYHMEGASGLVQSRVQADCWAGTYKDAVRLSRAVRAALSGYRAGNTQGAFIDAERQTVEKETDGAQRYHRVILDFIIWHAE
jgi:hypothetical protein